MAKRWSRYQRFLAWQGYWKLLIWSYLRRLYAVPFAAEEERYAVQEDAQKPAKLGVPAQQEAPQQESQK